MAFGADTSVDWCLIQSSQGVLYEVRLENQYVGLFNTATPNPEMLSMGVPKHEMVSHLNPRNLVIVAPPNEFW